MSKAYQRLIKYEPHFHVLFWISTMLYQYIKFLESGYATNPLHCFVELFFNMIPAYVLYFLILPLKNKKYIIPLVIFMFLANLVLFLYVDHFFHLDNPVYNQWTVIVIIVIRHLSISLVFFGLYSIKELFKQQQVIETITTKEQQAQLRFLKSQINPHFLFNTLNTIYVSALDKEDKTPDLILKLSDNFRYVLHEGQKNTVALEKEIRHLKDYIKLQKERLFNKVIINWEENIDNYDQAIPPLLLISFVENAFKYSSMLTGNNHIIDVAIQLQNCSFYFFCKNSYTDFKTEAMEVNWKESGIGIQNTQKRLELLFPNRHTLGIDYGNNEFKVHLNITL